MSERRATIERDTLETRIRVSLDLDGSGAGTRRTGVGFFDHMLDQLARHGLFDLEVSAAGDLHIDAHHTVEDVGIALGQAFAAAVGEKRGIVRYGHAFCPLDEALSRVVVDLSGRPGLYYRVTFPTARVGDFDTELVREFWQGFASQAAVTLHMDSLQGDNAHHVAETLFKAGGRALRMACSSDPRSGNELPSTKGAL
ncbi:imidazoleglycerol-phosphate dehydratase HisB [Spiribacter aquaticus]|jgi:imidazoleglycerol-phosphate dehydratase|uniref:Imidazoleglycerol-phosphate dehydratase n=1 Tax=Spiribacter aquaticus TaxID=1935996 RepID=A0A557RMH5_9GAMM|nr:MULTISPECIES: imidazoleglycerol-phosphate dehydratase HisB [Spiribacter]KAF0279408.1 imidazoleglycerol-phosphate dehydratase [Spiribacter roseus]TVO66361.1 imidazoleglycerol-phosphate dehydratase HisB [Spiribacter aquaticus]